MVNISREAIDKWQRPAATLDFLIDDALKIESFITGNTIDFTFEIRGDDFVITDFDSKQEATSELSLTEPKLQE
jgi:Cu(I)/Ag(I) efflux system membrane fusion protein